MDAARGDGRRTEWRGSDGALVALCRSVRDVLLPRGCAGCDMPDAVLCDDCRALFDRCHGRELQGSLSGMAYAAAIYQGVVRRCILDWKDHDDVELDGSFARILIATLARSGLMSVLSSLSAMPDCGPDLRRPVLVVPAPSSPASMRRRGRRHLMPLVRALSEALCESGIPSRPSLALVSTAGGGRSVQQISAAQRAQRIGGHIAVAPGASLRGAPVLLVDDIITTGSTLRQCTDVLRHAGALPVGALALAQAVASHRGDGEGDESDGGETGGMGTRRHATYGVRLRQRPR